MMRCCAPPYMPSQNFGVLCLVHQAALGVHMCLGQDDPQCICLHERELGRSCASKGPGLHLSAYCKSGVRDDEVHGAAAGGKGDLEGG